MDMPPLYLPIKKKSIQCPVVQETHRICDMKNDGPMNQMNGTKRFEAHPRVPLTTIDYPSTSCSVMSSAPLSNGAAPGFMIPPPPLVLQSSGPHRDPGWNCTQDRSSDPWAPGREVWGGRKVPAWGSNRDGDTGRQGFGTDFQPQPGPSTGPGLDPGLQAGPDRGWTPAPEREERWREPQWSNRPPVISNGPNAAVAGPSSAPTPGPSGVQSSPEPKPSPVLGRKEPPVYPPGSQEEQWQTQISAKGRVTCPRCKSVSRKTVEGLKKHMDNCRAEPYTCPHCGKQLKTNTGMKYHIMADHSLLPSSDAKDMDDRATKDKLRKILKRLGKLKCSREGCGAGFTSVMGYLYHMRTCGKQQDELEKLVLSCSHCGKNYRSKAGLEYHIRNEHAPAPEDLEPHTQPLDDVSPETSACGRAKRASAQAANIQMAQIAQNELPKDWGKRKFQSDLVPEDHKLQYTRPGLPSFSQDVLKKWRSEVKMYRKVQCPNPGCGCTYTSVSGLKAHLGLCTKGDFAAGKYRCLICSKEFNSESGVKYHINSVHSQEWFVTNKKHLKTAPKDCPHSFDLHHHHHQQQQRHVHTPCPHQMQPLPPLHHIAAQTHQNHQIYNENVPHRHGDTRSHHHHHRGPELYTPMQPHTSRSSDQVRQDQVRQDQVRQDQVRQDQVRQDQVRQDQGRQEQGRQGGAARCGFEYGGLRGESRGEGPSGFTLEMERQIWDEKRRMLESVEIVRRQPT
ncbi:hypothetical protein NQD34_017549 [Periophthalmus magnuspinnatus]|nr:hypothetical protein NQD34_017549 [Periophthalmus magnuspinnatus]